MAREPTSMTAYTGYFPLTQEQDGVGLTYSPTPWLVARKVQVVNFIIKNAGLLLVICSQFFGASMNLSAKLLEKLDPPTSTLEVCLSANAVTSR